jgi:hypothetical protein
LKEKVLDFAPDGTIQDDFTLVVVKCGSALAGPLPH